MIKILLIEDNPGDARLTEEALKETGLEFHLVVQSNGEKALEYLKKNSQPEVHDLPSFILLDLNLPRIDGREVLKQIKQNPLIKKIPVIILTTSDDKTDILTSYEYHANCYLKKPINLEEFNTVVQTLKNFWFDHATLPAL